MDIFSIPGKRIRDGLISNLRTAKPKAQKLIDLLNQWDCNLDKESIGGTIYQVFLYTLVKNIVEPQLGKTLTERYLGIGEHPLLLPVNELLGHSTEAIIRIFKNPNSKWVPSGKFAVNLIEKSLVESCYWLEKKLGNEPSDWGWGKIHKAEFYHSLAIKKPFDKINCIFFNVFIFVLYQNYFLVPKCIYILFYLFIFTNNSFIFWNNCVRF